MEGAVINGYRLFTTEEGEGGGRGVSSELLLETDPFKASNIPSQAANKHSFPDVSRVDSPEQKNIIDHLELSITLIGNILDTADEQC